jgi:hypothetical protein
VTKFCIASSSRDLAVAEISPRDRDFSYARRVGLAPGLVGGQRLPLVADFAEDASHRRGTGVREHQSEAQPDSRIDLHKASSLRLGVWQLQRRLSRSS